MKRTHWNPDQTPKETTVAKILYDMRREPDESLLFDAVSIDDVVKSSDGVIALDALVSPYARLDIKMTALQNVMSRLSSEIKPISFKISEPYTLRNEANVAVVFELSDGQTVTIFFRNSDPMNPKKIVPAEQLLSWKWMLNKKDVTLVVAPEKGQDLDLKRVAARIMKLAVNNSPAFARKNKNRAEKLAAYDVLLSEIKQLEADLKQAQNDLEVAKIENEDKQAVTPTDNNELLDSPPIKANPNATTIIADAIQNAIESMQGIVKTGDGLVWALSKNSLNKMIAATNKDGAKAYQKERIIAIQQLQELANTAKNPLIRADDGRDGRVNSIYEYFAMFDVLGKTLKVRMLCKHFANPDKRLQDKMHSIAMDEAVPAFQIVPDGEVDDLEIVLLDVIGAGTDNQELSPSVENPSLNIPQPQENSTKPDNSQIQPSIDLLNSVINGDYDNETDNQKLIELADKIEKEAETIITFYGGTLDAVADNFEFETDDDGFIIPITLDSINYNPKTDKWVTTESGSHLLIRKGKVAAGAGGKFNGQSYRTKVDKSNTHKLKGHSVAHAINELENDYGTSKDVWNAKAKDVQAMSDHHFKKLVDNLENSNYHTEATLLKAKRHGNKKLIDMARSAMREINSSSNYDSKRLAQIKRDAVDTYLQGKDAVSDRIKHADKRIKEKGVSNSVKIVESTFKTHLTHLSTLDSVTLDSVSDLMPESLNTLIGDAATKWVNLDKNVNG